MWCVLMGECHTCVYVPTCVCEWLCMGNMHIYLHQKHPFTTHHSNLFSANTPNEYSARGLLTHFVVFFILATITHGIAVPSGLFVPCIVCGATYGRLVGLAVVTALPGSHMDEGTYALLGAASFLGGAMRSTVSLCVMLLELTGHLNLLPLIMLVLLVAKV